MVSSCFANNCTARWSAENKLYRFPSDNKLRKRWFNATRRKHVDVKAPFLCSKHFKSSDFKTTASGRKKLKNGVVPTIFDFGKDCLLPRKSRWIDIRTDMAMTGDHETADSMEVEDLNESSDVTEETVLHINELDVSTQTMANNCDIGIQSVCAMKEKGCQTYDVNVMNTNNKFKMTIRNLKRKLKRRDSRIKTLEAQVEKLMNSNDDIPTIPTHMIPFIENEKVNTERFRATFSKFIKEFSWTMRFYSPKAYKFLRQYMKLPSVRTLQSWSADIDVADGFLEPVLKELGKKESEERHVSLVFDEMHIKTKVIIAGLLIITVVL